MFCQLKLQYEGEIQRLELEHPVLLYFIHFEQCKGMGNGGCSEPITAPLCSSFFLTLLPFCSMNPPQAAVLQDEPSAAWAPLCRPVLLQGIFTCSDVGSSTDCREIPVPPWPSQLATGKSAPAPGAPPPTLSSQTLGFAGLLLTHVLPQPSLPVGYFVLSWTCFLRRATSLAGRISCGLGRVPVGPGWTQPCLAQGSPQAFTQSSSAASPSLPTPSHLPPVQTVH